MLLPAPVFALSAAAQEFMAISRELEPVQCEKRRLRRKFAANEMPKTVVAAPVREAREEADARSFCERQKLATGQRWLFVQVKQQVDPRGFCGC